MRLADPKPGICSVCYCADPEKRYVDFEVAFDGHPVLTEDGRIALLPNGMVGSHDDLNICETCMRGALELLELKPELHARQLREIRRQEIEISHWKATALRFKDQLDHQLAATLEPPARGPGRPRKVVANA